MNNNYLKDAHNIMLCLSFLRLAINEGVKF